MLSGMHAGIAIGGAAGALARYAVALLAGSWSGGVFPWGTLVANVSGSWLLGVLMRVLPVTMVKPAIRGGLTIGFCGGFTTFSTFAFDALLLVRLGQPSLAAAYIAASLLIGVASVVAGLAAGAWMVRRRGPAPAAALPGDRA